MVKKQSRNYYAEIDAALLSYETCKPYHIRSIDWICNRIDWCWKFRHITKDQMIELADRICDVMDCERELLRLRRKGCNNVDN